jgi:hypothetical protein
VCRGLLQSQSGSICGPYFNELNAKS